MSAADEFLKSDEQYVASFSKGDLPMPPGRKVAVVTCMDARLDPAKFLGLQEGDAHMIRNAGGRVGDAIRSLVISQQLLGTRRCTAPEAARRVARADQHPVLLVLEPGAERARRP